MQPSMVVVYKSNAQVECLSPWLVLIKVLLLFVFCGGVDLLVCLTPFKAKIYKLSKLKFECSVSNVCSILDIPYVSFLLRNVNILLFYLLVLMFGCLCFFSK